MEKPEDTTSADVGVTEKRIVWVAYTKTNLTEGRGHDVPIAVCAAETTAFRLARKSFAQGGDGPVRTMELVNINGEWYAPIEAIVIVEPNREDIELEAWREAMAKMKAAGLTDAELRALVSAATKGGV